MPTPIPARRFEVVTPFGPVNVTLSWPANAAAFYFRCSVGDKRLYASTGKKTPKEARVVAEDEIRKAIHVAASTPLHLSDALNLYLEKRIDSSHGHKTRLLRFAEYAGALNLAMLDEEAATHLVQRYLDSRKGAIEALTIRSERVCVSTFFAWLMRQRNEKGERLIAWRVNPAYAKLLSSPKVPKKILPLVPPETLQRLLEVSKETDLYPAIVLMLSGLRPKGMSTVSWAVADLGERPHVTVKEKENTRAVALGSWAAGELRAWKERFPNKPAMPSTDDSVIHRKLKMLREIFGLPDSVTLQALRRTADFKLYQSGAAPQSAAKIMDHSVQTAMSHYVNYTQLDAAGAVENLNFAKPVSSVVVEKVVESTGGKSRPSS